MTPQLVHSHQVTCVTWSKSLQYLPFSTPPNILGPFPLGKRLWKWHIGSKCWEIFVDDPSEILAFAYMLVQGYTQPKNKRQQQPSYSSSKLVSHQECKAIEFGRQCTGWIQPTRIIHGHILNTEEFPVWSQRIHEQRGTCIDLCWFAQRSLLSQLE